MRNRPANGEQRQADDAPGNDADMTVTAETEIQRNDADRYDDDEHFHVQVIVAELAEKRQYRDGEGQQQAMQQAKARQRYRYLVQDRRLSGTVLHDHLPLCFRAKCRFAAGD